MELVPKSTAEAKRLVKSSQRHDSNSSTDGEDILPDAKDSVFGAREVFEYITSKRNSPYKSIYRCFKYRKTNPSNSIN